MLVFIVYFLIFTLLFLLACYYLWCSYSYYVCCCWWWWWWGCLLCCCCCCCCCCCWWVVWVVFVVCVCCSVCGWCGWCSWCVLVVGWCCLAKGKDGCRILKTGSWSCFSWSDPERDPRWVCRTQESYRWWFIMIYHDISIPQYIYPLYIYILYMYMFAIINVIMFLKYNLSILYMPYIIIYVYIYILSS